jgi:AraC-like DNA-binding protein
MHLIRTIFCVMIASAGLCAQEVSGPEFEGMINQVSQHLNSKALHQADSLGYLILEKLQKSDSANDTFLVNTYFLLGTIEFYKARYWVSVSFFEKTLNHPLVKNRSSLRNQILNSLGSSQVYLGKLPEALNSFQQALKISEQLNDQEAIIDLWVNMAELEFELGHYKESIALTHKALKASESPIRINYCHLNLGKSYTFDTQLDKGYYHTQTALSGFSKLNDTYYIVASLVNLAIIEQKQKNFQASTQTMQKAMDMARANKFDKFIVPALIHQSQNVILSGQNLPMAKDYALEAIRLTRISGRRDHMEESTLELAKYYAAVGDMKSFSNTMDEYNNIREETVRLNANAAAEEFKAIYEQERLSAENKALRQNIRFKNQQLLFALLGLITLTLTGTIIYAQNRKLKQNMKTMFQMNVNLAYAHPGGTQALESPTESSEDDTVELSDVELFKLILRKIETKELYKDPNLGLYELAKHVKQSRTNVSKAINIVGKTNFASFINSFKVNEARRLLLEKGNEMPIRDIATAAGFNSRMSFNRHFKELTGFTPSQYLQMSNREVEEDGDAAGDGQQDGE